MGLTPTPKVLEKSSAIPLLTLKVCVAYKKGENLPRKQNINMFQEIVLLWHKLPN